MDVPQDEGIISSIYRGEAGDIPLGDRFVKIIVDVHKSVTAIRGWAFIWHQNIVLFICHEGVEKIGTEAFSMCTSLRRIVMRGVKIVEWDAFNCCTALMDVQCDKLEIIKSGAFRGCTSLRSINLPSVEIVEKEVFNLCTALTDVKFGSKLERIDDEAFINCFSLERITIPLKDGLINGDGVFVGCANLNYVDLVRGEIHETIAALQLDDWRNDMNEEIESINQILPNTYVGEKEYNEAGENAWVIRRWIRSLLRKIIHYQAEHQRYVDEARSTLYHALPHDIVMKNVLPFLDLPSYTFEVDDYEDEESDSDSDDEDEMDDYEDEESDSEDEDEMDDYEDEESDSEDEDEMDDYDYEDEESDSDDEDEMDE